jgi:hypothetical protein
MAQRCANCMGQVRSVYRTIKHFLWQHDIHLVLKSVDNSGIVVQQDDAIGEFK